MFSFTHFIKNLQQSPIEVRKRWLFGFSLTSFIIIIALGMFYFNLTLPQNQNPQIASAENATLNTKESSSFFNIFSRGISVFFEDAKNVIQKSTTQIDRISSVFQNIQNTTSTASTSTGGE